jgi:hypothetical protein
MFFNLMSDAVQVPFNAVNDPVTPKFPFILTRLLSNSPYIKGASVSELSI